MKAILPRSIGRVAFLVIVVSRLLEQLNSIRCARELTSMQKAKRKRCDFFSRQKTIKSIYFDKPNIRNFKLLPIMQNVSEKGIN